MNFNTIQQPLIEALGWTLIHSLWQGLIITTLLTITIRFIKNKSPRLTYQLCCLSLICLVAWMCNTFINHFHWPVEANTILADISPIASSDDFAFFANTLSWQQNIDIFFQSFIQSYADELVMLWLLGVGVFSLKWFGSLYFTYTLKRHNISSAPSEWKKTVQKFSQKLGIKKAISIVQSTKVDVPMVIGYLRPVILMPASMATGFTSEQIESIIVHELAHVKSNDFLIGLILSAMEVVLFYHPMYWWVSGIISEEREKCCDDIAVAQCGNPLLYARTLFSIAEQKQQRSLALSLQGKKNQLFDRIKRVCISPQGKASNNNNKTGMALGLLFVLAIIALAQVPSQAKEAIFEPVKEAFIEQFQADSKEESLEIEAATVVETNIEDDLTEEDFAKANQELISRTDTIVPLKASKSNIILLTKLDQDGNIYITKKDTDGQAYAYLIKKGEGKIYIDRTELEPGNHKLNLNPASQITFIGTTLILDRDDIDLDNLDKVFDGDIQAASQYYEEAQAQLEDDSSNRKSLKAKKGMTFSLEEAEEFELEEGEEGFAEVEEEFAETEEEFAEVEEEFAEAEEAIAHQKELMNEQLKNQKERHEQAMERHEEALERQQESMERHREALERQQEKIERQQESMERKREEMERQREEMERNREALQERMEQQREIHEEQMNIHREKLEQDMERREEEHERLREHNDKFHELLSENLFNDGLSKKKLKYKFELSLYELKVNKKKQNTEMHKKYLELYQNHYGTVLKETSNVTIQRN